MQEKAKQIVLNYFRLHVDKTDNIRLSLDDIKKASEKTKKKVKKIASPYTLERKQQRSIPAGLIYALIVLVIAIIIYCIVLIATDNKHDEDGDLIMNTEEKYEFA